MFLTGKERAKANLWGKKFVDSLPDDAFLVIEKDYAKGSCKDKRARHLPVKDGDGNLLDLGVAERMIDAIKPVSGSESADELKARARAALETLKQEPGSPPEEAGDKETPNLSEGGKAQMDEKKLQEQVEALQAELDKAKADNEKLAGELAEFKEKEQNQALADKQEEVRNLEATIETLKASIAELEGKVETLEGAKAELEEANKQLDEAKKGLEAEIAKRDEAEAERKVEARKAQANKLKEHLEEDQFNKVFEKAEDLDGTSDEMWGMLMDAYAHLGEGNANTEEEDEHVQASEDVGDTPTSENKSGGRFAGLRNALKE